MISAVASTVTVGSGVTSGVDSAVAVASGVTSGVDSAVTVGSGIGSVVAVGSGIGSTVTVGSGIGSTVTVGSGVLMGSSPFSAKLMDGIVNTSMQSDRNRLRYRFIIMRITKNLLGMVQAYL